jgi:NADPH-dependent 2,4-dienoyl-CoA reductase/sulfur reductase-like enzyme
MPHDIPKTSGAARHIVIVGAGPAGLEAARVSAERGHKVTLLEAAPQAGGQVRLAAKVKRRAELIGIIDWRLAQLDKLGVDVRYNTYAEAGDVTGLTPDVVIVATGGLPREDGIAEGGELATSSWDVISGDASIGEDVLLYDDNGAHPGMAASEAIMAAGSKLEIVSPERMFAPEIGGLNLVPYVEKLQGHGAAITTMTRVRSLRREGNKIAATLTSPYNEAVLGERLVDQVVVEYATTPLDDLYFALKPGSQNHGEVDYEALVAGKPQQVVRNKDGAYQLFRIGDAVASRNIHAGIYDALRLCKDL